MENLALTTLLLPFIGALVVSFSPQRRAAEWGVLFAALTTLCMLSLISAFYQADKVAVTLTLVNVGDVALFGLVIDRVSTLILFVVVFLGLLVTIYSTGYLTDKNREHPHNGTNRYYAFLLLFIGAMAGLVLSSTLLGQLLFFEITGGCSRALISYYQSDKAQRSALKALLITHIGSLGLYLAAATLFLQTGTFALSAMSELHGDARYLVYGGILFAAWGKSAQLPMQAWLPDAMEAPTPISAYLHAASMVKVGVYIFARAIIDGGNIPHVIGGVGMVMALVTILYGFLMYLPQQDMKRLLAWSTITQLGWMFFGLSLSIFGSRLALEGSIAYIVNHAFAKSLFFLVAGALSYSCGTRLLPRLRGVLHTLPLPGVGFCVAALAITGVPPFNGFFSKFPLFAAGFALSVEYWILLPAIILLMIESVASFAWFIRWFGRVVPGKPSEAVADAAPLPGSMRLVLIVLFVISVKSYRLSCGFYACQSLVLVSIFATLSCLFAAEQLLIWSASAFITKVLLVPLIMTYAARNIPQNIPEKALFGPAMMTLLAALIVLLCAFVVQPVKLPMATGLKPALAVALGHFLLGLLCIVSQRNILRQIFGYCLMENGSHLVLALLAWRAPELVEIGIATDAIFAVIVMVLLARKIWRTHGTLDVNNLTALKG
ncbi:hydrogenase 4 subunit D [Escherichia coli]